MTDMLHVMVLELPRSVTIYAYKQWRLQDIFLGGLTLYIHIFQRAKMSLFTYIA